jgi:hypothetical protein
MPEWHYPSGATLRVLATLSDRVDWLDAKELLRAEIELRNKDLQGEARSMILLTRDIWNAIGKASSSVDTIDESDTAPGLHNLIGARPRRLNVPKQSVELPVPLLKHVGGSIQKAPARPEIEGESRPRTNAGASMLSARTNPDIASSSIAVTQNKGQPAVAQFSEYQSWRKRAVPDGESTETQPKRPKTTPERPRSSTVSETEFDNFDAGSNHRANVSGMETFQLMNKTPADTIKVKPGPNYSLKTAPEQSPSEGLHGATLPITHQRNPSFSHESHQESTNREHTTGTRGSWEKHFASSTNVPRATELLEKVERAETLGQQELAK